MSYAHRILTQMRAGCIYRPCDISAMTNIDRDTVSRVLKMLARGGACRWDQGQRVPAQAHVCNPAKRFFPPTDEGKPMTEETQSAEATESREQAIEERNEAPECETCFWRRVTDGRCHNPQSLTFNSPTHGEGCDLYEPA